MASRTALIVCMDLTGRVGTCCIADRTAGANGGGLGFESCLLYILKVYGDRKSYKHQNLYAYDPVCYVTLGLLNAEHD
jgi:hypothetical protein